MTLTADTHKNISPELVGKIDSLEHGKAVVNLPTVQEMVADEYGLIHGGFIFGLADYAAMLAVNEPTVVLGSAETSFLAPVKVKDVAQATAIVVKESGKKREVECMVKVGNKIVFKGLFTCFVVEKHVLS
ncbi:MAG: thioesterase [Desulfobacteraceae bacterium 4572_35.1]|nr:MAG: thioesterase [Desulfobacteraceae bacterium 4572_35.1]